MREIYNEILSEFYNTSIGIYKINDFYIIKDNRSYGVAIENINNLTIDERLANVEIKSIIFETNSLGSLNLLVLTSSLKASKNEFASFCIHFVDKGQDGSNRELVVNNPLKWWNNWKELIGNKVSNKSPYDVVAELLTFEKLVRDDINTKWAGPTGSTIDLETSNAFYEVKASIVRFENEVTISSQFQVDDEPLDKDINLIYMKMENIKDGESINKIMNRLSKIEGLDTTIIEEELHKMGFRTNTSIRNTSYIIHEVRLYTVDEEFPKITNSSFKDGLIPANVKKINYTISLEGIKYKKMDW